jgi:hypothetical protein
VAIAHAQFDRLCISLTGWRYAQPVELGISLPNRAGNLGVQQQSSLHKIPQPFGGLTHSSCCFRLVCSFAATNVEDHKQCTAEMFASTIVIHHHCKHFSWARPQQRKIWECIPIHMASFARNRYTHVCTAYIHTCYPSETPHIAAVELDENHNTCEMRDCNALSGGASSIYLARKCSLSS